MAMRFLRAMWVVGPGEARAVQGSMPAPALGPPLTAPQGSAPRPAGSWDSTRSWPGPASVSPGCLPGQATPQQVPGMILVPMSYPPPGRQSVQKMASPGATPCPSPRAVCPVLHQCPRCVCLRSVWQGWRPDGSGSPRELPASDVDELVGSADTSGRHISWWVGLGEQAPEPATRASLGPKLPFLGTFGSTFTNGWAETKAQTQKGAGQAPRLQGRAGTGQEPKSPQPNPPKPILESRVQVEAPCSLWPPAGAPLLAGDLQAHLPLRGMPHPMVSARAGG